ncbi:MAG: ribosome-associated translation inhibitor RaiA [Pseudomonadota bacterium]
MRLYFHFRHTKPSKRIQNHLEERVEKLKKFELKPVSCDVTLKLEGGVHWVEMHTSGNGPVMRAHGKGHDFFEAVEVAMGKLERQMEKKKAKVKNHKCYERSHHGKLDQLDESLSMASEAVPEEAA